MKYLISFILLLLYAVPTGEYKPKYFDFSEFDSPDQQGSGEKYMSRKFIKKLDNIRERVGVMKVNSGYRSPDHNNSVQGSSSNSAHMSGLAADIHCPSLEFMRRLVRESRREGVKRIGQYISRNNNYFVHLDIDDSKPYQGEWALDHDVKVDLFVPL